MNSDLIRDFGEAGLSLTLCEEPIRRLNLEIFQMDILRDHGTECFRIWRGHSGNRIDVPSFDRNLRQLILIVREPRRRFEEQVSRRMSRNSLKNHLRMTGGQVVRETGRFYVIARYTPGTERRYLCGFDERHLFVAQFEKGKTVRDAHVFLKPEELREAERSGCGGTLRQGEWFFVRPLPRERRALRAHLRGPYGIVYRKEPLGRGERPHVAERLARMDEKTFARGAVRHPDHETLVLESWRRVFPNAEIKADDFGANGLYWID